MPYFKRYDVIYISKRLMLLYTFVKRSHAHRQMYRTVISLFMQNKSIELTGDVKRTPEVLGRLFSLHFHRC